MNCKGNENCDYYSRECKCGSEGSCDLKPWAPTCNFRAETDSYSCECGLSGVQCNDESEICNEVEGKCVKSKLIFSHNPKREQTWDTR